VVAVGVEVVVGAVVTVPGVVVDVVRVGATVCSNVIFLQYINVIEKLKLYINHKMLYKNLCSCYVYVK